VDAEEIPYQYRFTASPDTAGRASRAFVRWNLRRGPIRIVLLCLFVVTALLVFAGAGSQHSTWYRLYAAAFWATPYTAFVLLLLAVIIGATSRRNFRQTIPAGATLQTGFGEHGFVTANQRSSSRISYSAVRSIAAHGDFVYLRLLGHPVVHLYPRELFPPVAVDHIQRFVAGATPARPGPLP
jgi:hypothetical protein